MRPAALRHRKRHPLLGLQRRWNLARRARTFSLIPSALQRFVKSICGIYLNVGLHTGALPVGSGQWVDEASERHLNEEVIAESVRRHGMRAAACGLTDQSSALEGFHVIAE